MQIHGGPLVVVIAVATRDYPKNDHIQHREPVIGQALFKRVVAYTVAYQRGVVRVKKTQLLVPSLLRRERLADERGDIVDAPAACAELPVKYDWRLRLPMCQKKAIVEAVVSMNNRPGRFQ